MLTRADIRTIERIFDQKLDASLDKMFREKMAPYLSLFDKSLGEIQAMREDFAILMYRNAEHNDCIENHEKRLLTLEALKERYAHPIR